MSHYTLVETVKHDEMGNVICWVECDGVILQPSVRFSEAVQIILDSMGPRDTAQERYLSTGTESGVMSRQEYEKG
jgi:hypothetical protein